MNNDEETKALLREILATQQESLAAYQEEAKRSTEFRERAIEIQRSAQRNGLVAALLVIVGGIVLIAGLLANR